MPYNNLIQRGDVSAFMPNVPPAALVCTCLIGANLAIVRVSPTCAIHGSPKR